MLLHTWRLKKRWVSKFEEFLKTSSAGHLAVGLIRRDCVYVTVDLPTYNMHNMKSSLAVTIKVVLLCSIQVRLVNWGSFLHVAAASPGNGLESLGPVERMGIVRTLVFFSTVCLRQFFSSGVDKAIFKIFSKVPKWAFSTIFIAFQFITTILKHESFSLWVFISIIMLRILFRKLHEN